MPAPRTLPTAAEMKGPAGDTNWVIPGKLLVGAAPVTEQMAGRISRAGVDVFVSLLDGYDYQHRFGAREYSAVAKQAGVVLVKFPIVDGSVTTDRRAFHLARKLYAVLRSGVNVYLHCWGGHGRAGTIAAMLIGLWYRVDLQTALRFVKRSHNTRGYGGGARSAYKTPQTQEQVRQVARFFARIDDHRRRALAEAQ
uniref:Dual specificity phosphatase n=1 Tax=Marseillevirus LCMAC103 TaxID=2506604 RepID=A0A481YUS9_9VIRU|nr:MAG: dual specificity phosphatase [Marseillevirus LCMAC103]